MKKEKIPMPGMDINKYSIRDLMQIPHKQRIYERYFGSLTLAFTVVDESKEREMPAYRIDDIIGIDYDSVYEIELTVDEEQMLLSDAGLAWSN
jgi:hypothetical protein